MQISLITPLFNRLDLTRACLESARRTLAGWDYEWIFIDDGSTDGTREFLRALPDDGRVRVVFNDAPRGFAANNNHGARLARSPLLCLLNNDLAFLPGWLEPMARVARLVPDVACVGNVQREPVSGLIDHAGMLLRRRRRGAPRRQGRTRAAARGLPGVAGGDGGVLRGPAAKFFSTWAGLTRGSATAARTWISACAPGSGVTGISWRTAA